MLLRQANLKPSVLPVLALGADQVVGQGGIGTDLRCCTRLLPTGRG